MAGEGIRGPMADLYDVFVDWEGRLGREMPGILKSLRGARRVLDVGCGTGRHLKALLDAGFDAHGADVSEDMLAQARAWTGAPERLHGWRLGEDAPDALPGPFDAVVCLGNTWPQITADDAVARAARSLRALVRPGGLLLAGMKAVEIRRETGNPYLPLLRREHERQPVYFIRFVDFAGGDADLCEFHMVVVRGEDEMLHHRAHPMRVWSPDGLRAAFAAAGFHDVKVSASLGDPGVTPATEDVFVHAR